MKGRHFLSWRAGLIALVLIVIGVGYFILANRGGPRADLSASEAVDFALFQTWTVAGGPADIAHPTEVFVADLADRDAQNFLRQNGATASLPADGLTGFVARTFIVVARGPVTAGPEADAATRAQGFALVIDRAGAVQYVGIGSPWDVAVPPGSQMLPVPADPSLGNVSRARARLELGGAPFVELTNTPGGASPSATPTAPAGRGSGSPSQSRLTCRTFSAIRFRLVRRAAASRTMPGTPATGASMATRSRRLGRGFS